MAIVEKWIPILIDEARTPLISQDSWKSYYSLYHVSDFFVKGFERRRRLHNRCSIKNGGGGGGGGCSYWSRNGEQLKNFRVEKLIRCGKTKRLTPSFGMQALRANFIQCFWYRLCCQDDQVMIVDRIYWRIYGRTAATQMGCTKLLRQKKA